MSPRLSPESIISADRSAYAASSQTGRLLCPHCLGSLSRVRRDLLDRLISVFVPVRRYRCPTMRCEWEGLLRISRVTPPVGDSIRRYRYRVKAL